MQWNFLSYHNILSNYTAYLYFTIFYTETVNIPLVCWICSGMHVSELSEEQIIQRIERLFTIREKRTQKIIHRIIDDQQKAGCRPYCGAPFLQFALITKEMIWWWCTENIIKYCGIQYTLQQVIRVRNCWYDACICCIYYRERVKQQHERVPLL